MSQEQNIFYQFGISHFCEKAKWVLDQSKMPYTTKFLVPGFHNQTILKLAEKSSVPVLQVGEQIIQGSSEIIDFLLARFNHIELDCHNKEWEKQTDLFFGYGSQVLIYHFILDDGDLFLSALSYGDERSLKLMKRIGHEKIGDGMRKFYNITEANVKKVEQQFFQHLKNLDAIYQKQDFLEDKFSRLDITVASLLSPWLMPEQHPYMAYLQSLTINYRTLSQQIQNSKTGQRCLQFYQQYRLVT